MWDTVKGVNPKPVSLKAKHLLFEQGTPQQGAYSVCSGLIKIFHTNRAAKKIIYKMAQSGEIIWEKSPREGLYFTSAQALIDSRLLYWSAADLEKLFQSKEAPTWEITLRLLEEIQSLRESLAILVTATAMFKESAWSIIAYGEAHSISFR
jgi:CRP-like cAMP-binding protein